MPCRPASRCGSGGFITVAVMSEILRFGAVVLVAILQGALDKYQGTRSPAAIR